MHESKVNIKCASQSLVITDVKGIRIVDLTQGGQLCFVEPAGLALFLSLVTILGNKGCRCLKSQMFATYQDLGLGLMDLFVLA